MRNAAGITPVHRQNESLSPAELRVLQTLAENGGTDVEIGEELGITEHTVNTHLGRIMDKLEIRKRGGLIAWAWRNDLM